MVVVPVVRGYVGLWDFVESVVSHKKTSGKAPDPWVTAI